MANDQKEAFLRSWFDVPEGVHWAHGMSNEVEKEVSESFDRAIAAWNTRPAAPVDLDTLVQRAKEVFDALTPEQQEKMWEETRKSFAENNVALSRPAAPVEGLEKVRAEHRVHFDEDGKPTEWREGYGMGCYPQEPIVRVEVRELCDRSQAEAIIAGLEAKIRARDWWNSQLVSHTEKLEADNAALTARVKELSEALDKQRELDNESTLHHYSRAKALETQLAAARKALEDIAHPKALTSLSRDKARAALEAKP